ncbi:lysozyme inhibitor LprI family protein [Clostridium sp. YIM B02555]|uniref:lysozyme inhibitor LprI family protein n=1 Tax=Clostridium sp. YIM B02555 TaxID=2911968 RepID=UPI001EEDE794|nr:lysozyme inhibitor LprI family protein [Clostridium sp. YIM B02555]
MKYKKTVIIVSIVLSLNTLVGCASNNTKIAQNNSDKVEQNEQVTGSTSNTESSLPTTADKIDGRREEFLGRLDFIQKQLDNLPEKKASDEGITNAMRSYYGEAYEKYDEALNEIYNLLKEQLPQNTMKNLQGEETKWINQKEASANKSASDYKGGTFELVAYNSSLYQSTKDRCYELVNNYMTDSKIKINANKQDYKNKLDSIEREIQSSQEYKNAESGVTHDMLVLTDKEYNEWDKELNEIYGLLGQELSSDEMKRLNKEETLWITQKENRAKKSEELQGVGSQLGKIGYQASLSYSTQSRCYELVYRYMK